MSSYTIQIDDEVLNSKISDILNTALNRQLEHRYSNTGEQIAAAVKELVYSRKDEIIEMVVDRASREIVKKALPRLLERTSG